MKRQLIQIFVLIGFGMISALFALFVPFGGNKDRHTADPVLNLSGVNSTFFEDEGEEKETIKISDELILLFPFNLRNDGWEIFVEQFQEDFGVPVQVSFYYSDVGLDLESIGDVDIALIPYDKISDTTMNALGLQEDYASLFHPVFSTILSERDDFLPFALDPIVTFANQELLLPFDLSAFSDFLLKWRKNNRFALPFFGLLDEVGFEQSNLIFSFWIDRLSKVKDIGGLRFFIDHCQQDFEEMDLALEFLNKIGIQDICYNFPNLCLFRQGIVDLYFGGYSEINTIQHLEKIDAVKNHVFFISTFPYQSGGYPARVYGFMLPKKSSYLTEKFFITYLQALLQHDDSLRENTLSAFVDFYAIHCQQMKLCDFLSFIDVLDIGNKRLNQILSDPILQNILQKKLDPSLFLKNTSL